MKRHRRAAVVSIGGTGALHHDENEIADAEGRLRAEMQAGFSRQQDQFARQQEQIADVHKQIALQTRWILAALGVAAVLFPIIQRLIQVIQVLLP